MGIPVRIAVGKIRRVAEPRCSAVLADEFRGKIEKVRLDAEIFQVGRDTPGPGDGVGFQDVGIEFPDGVGAVGHAHQVFFKRCIISHRDAAHIVVPLDDFLGAEEDLQRLIRDFARGRRHLCAAEVLDRCSPAIVSIAVTTRRDGVTRQR